MPPDVLACFEAEKKMPSKSDNAERTLFSLMGMDATESTVEEAEVHGLQLRGLLVAFGALDCLWESTRVDSGGFLLRFRRF